MAAMKVPLLPMTRHGLVPGRSWNGGGMGSGQAVVGTVWLGQRLPRPSGLLMFESAARQQSFTLAGGKLRVTQSAASQQVRALEQQLGVTLFIRLIAAFRTWLQGYFQPPQFGVGAHRVARVPGARPRARMGRSMTMGSGAE
jgi:hypothetical protein